MSRARQDALRRAAERHYAPLATVLSARAAVMDAKGKWPPPGNDRSATWVAAAALMLCWALEIDPNTERGAA